jgi:hypothetical protein
MSTAYERTDLPAPKGLPVWRRPFEWRGQFLAIVSVVLILAVVVLLYLAIYRLPGQLVPRPVALDALKGAERVKAETDLAAARNGVRTSLIQAIGGALFFVTAGVAWLQVQTARRGQLIDRFTKSIDQLGDEKLDVRLGGIFALRQMARTKAYRNPIARILAAYLRTHSDVEPRSAALEGGHRRCVRLFRYRGAQTRRPPLPPKALRRRYGRYEVIFRPCYKSLS